MEKCILYPARVRGSAILKGAMHHNWEHQVPQRKHVTGERINLTFRKIM
jgi:hypothetical protein